MLSYRNHKNYPTAFLVYREKIMPEEIFFLSPCDKEDALKSPSVLISNQQNTFAQRRYVIGINLLMYLAYSKLHIFHKQFSKLPLAALPIV